MTNFVKDGTTLTYLNTSTAILSGAVVLMGTIVGIAVANIAATTGSGAVQVVGVFNLAAAAGAWTQGDQLYWDAGASDFTTTASGNTKAGIAAAAKASATLLGDVAINAGN
jgi:predicted RecA/RadA family phage recombinase